MTLKNYSYLHRQSGSTVGRGGTYRRQTIAVASSRCLYLGQIVPCGSRSSNSRVIAISAAGPRSYDKVSSEDQSRTLKSVTRIAAPPDSKAAPRTPHPAPRRQFQILPSQQQSDLPAPPNILRDYSAPSAVHESARLAHPCLVCRLRRWPPGACR